MRASGIGIERKPVFANVCIGGFNVVVYTGCIKEDIGLYIVFFIYLFENKETISI